MTLEGVLREARDTQAAKHGNQRQSKQMRDERKAYCAEAGLSRLRVRNASMRGSPRKVSAMGSRSR